MTDNELKQYLLTGLKDLQQNIDLYAGIYRGRGLHTIEPTFKYATDAMKLLYVDTALNDLKEKD